MYFYVIDWTFILPLIISVSTNLADIYFFEFFSRRSQTVAMDSHGGVCNLQEARALLGRYEYQKGNVEAALHVFEGIDISTVAPKIKSTLARRGEQRRRSSQNFATPPLSMHAVSLLLEAIFLKSKSLQALGRFKGSFRPLLILFLSSVQILGIIGGDCTYS